MKIQIATQTTSTITLNTDVSRDFTTALGMLIPPTAPPFVVIICDAIADKTDIIATVVTKTGI